MLLTNLSQAQGQSHTEGNTVRIAVIGDYGLAGQPELDVANLVKSWNPDLILTTGDNNYPSGSPSTIDQNVGQFFHQFIANYKGRFGSGSTINRFFPVLSDHDYNESPSLLGYQPYLDYFTLPGNERYYDFSWGPVHIFCLNSHAKEPDGNRRDSLQAQWLRQKLVSSTAVWKLVVLHHPPYSSGDNPVLGETRWPFKEWGATAVLSGDQHLYERLVVNGLTYFVNGKGGHPYTSKFLAPVAGSQRQYNEDFGAMLIEADSASISFKFITRGGHIIDTYTIPSSTPPLDANCLPTSGRVGGWQANGSGADVLGVNTATLRFGASYGPGKLGQAFSFDGGSAAASLPLTALHNSLAELSVSAWVYASSHGRDSVPGYGIYGRTVLSNTHGDGLALRVRDGYVQADLRLTSGNVLQTFTGAQVGLNEWTHVAVVYGEGQVRGYVNGREVGRASVTGVVAHWTEL